MRKVYNKLVRDKIPQIIESNGGIANIRILSKTAYVDCLESKLKEEIEEFIAEKNIEKFTDILEIIDAICETNGVSLEKILAQKQHKKISRGGFGKKVFLLNVD